MSWIPFKATETTKKLTCKISGCDYNMEKAKIFHQRCRCCPDHAAMPSVDIQRAEGTIEQCRFCQQCAKFHPLSEFDGAARSCRDQLKDHNDRRQKKRRAPAQQTQGQASTLPSPFSLGMAKDTYQPKSAGAVSSLPQATAFPWQAQAPPPAPLLAQAPFPLPLPILNWPSHQQRPPPPPPPTIVPTSDALISNWTQIFPDRTTLNPPCLIPTPGTQPLGPSMVETSFTPSTSHPPPLPPPAAERTTKGNDTGFLNPVDGLVSMDEPIVSLPNADSLLLDGETPPLPTGLDWSPPIIMGGQSQEDPANYLTYSAPLPNIPSRTTSTTVSQTQQFRAATAAGGGQPMSPYFVESLARVSVLEYGVHYTDLPPDIYNRLFEMIQRRMSI